jgi:hypothetical protein
VEVVGTPGTTAEHTSVDRTYQIGTWYVFDPGNATSPFRDQAGQRTVAIVHGARTTGV